MQFGIRLLQHLGSPSHLIELAVLAEEAGFDYVWFPHDPFMYHTWPLLTAAAQRTERIKVCTIATNPYTTDPSEIAAFIATVDSLSDGRAVLGLGLHTEEMVGWVGIDASDYLVRTREAVAMIRALLRGEVVDYQGQAFKWSDQCYLRFKPLRPDIPIYVAGFGPEYFELSGAIGDGSLPMITPPESAPGVVKFIAAGAQKAGRDLSAVDISGCAWLSISEQRREAAAALRPIVAYFGPYFDDTALATIGLSSADFVPIKQLVDQAKYDEAAAQVSDQMLRLALVGTPSDLVERIEQLEADGITQVNLGGPLGPDPAEAIRLMGKKVIPHFL